MNANVTTDQKITLAAAAVTAVGPMGADRNAWRRQVADVLEELAREVFTGGLGEQIDRIAAEKAVTGVITAIAHDQRSNRAVVTIKVPESRFSADGEKIRTDRLENPTAKDLAGRIKNDLIGHRVTVWKQTETTPRGDFVVLRHVVDRGPATEVS